MSIDIKTLTIEKAREHLSRGDFSSVELAEECLAVVAEKNPTINAYLEVFDDCLEKAKEADKKLKNGENDSALLGIPLAIKDNILIEGKIASCASKMLERYRATYSATAIKKLEDAGALFLGRTNMDEFAMGASTEHSAFGVTKNPHDTSRVPGGSSGGSAAALAMGSALGALGSDTAGSVRQPASFCGLVGMKPTYGAVSRSGLVAMASSFDQIGPFAKTVSDAEILFHTITGKDPLDSTSTDFPKYKIPQYHSRAGYGARQDTRYKHTIGVPRTFLESVPGGIDADVYKNFTDLLEALKANGYTIEDIDIPHLADVLPVYYIIMPAEVGSNLARFDGVRYGLQKEGTNLLDDYELSRSEGFGPETKRRILVGTYVLSSGYYDAYYGKAVALKNVIRREVDAVFQHVSAIALPTTPTPAFKLGEKSDPVAMYLSDVFTAFANVVGIPAISVPSGMVERDGVSLPVGFQVMASHFHDDTLFVIGRDVEHVRGQ